jgi:hypothetical protein
MIYEVPHISIFIGQNGAEAEVLAVIPTVVANSKFVRTLKQFTIAAKSRGKLLNE